MIFAALLLSAQAFAAPRAVPDLSSLRPVVLDAPRIETLRSLMVEAAPDFGVADRAISEEDFQAVVVGEPAARRAMYERIAARPEEVSYAKNRMYDAVVRVFKSGLPMDERTRTVAAMSERFGEFFDGLAEHAAGRRAVAAGAKEAAARFRDPGQIILPFLRERQARARWEELQGAYALLRPAETRREGRLPDWTIPPIANHVPDPRTKGQLEEYRVGLDQIMEEMSQARAELARGEAPSETFLEKLKDRLGWWDFTIRRFSATTIRKGIDQRKVHRVWFPPTNAGLTLVQRGRELTLQARFKTDIADPRVTAIVKRSIEDFWRGEFEYAGRRYSFSTQVSIEPLAPGQPFPDDHLRLMDGGLTGTSANTDRIVLGRGAREFDYDVAAHEFGHILGLADEYRETFDPGTMEAVHTQVRGLSLMADNHGGGVVLPRHLKLAYQLLRRRHLLVDGR